MKNGFTFKEKKWFYEYLPCRELFYLTTISDIPHFKDVIIMATSCELCDYKDNEVKSGGAIEDKGCCIDLHIKDMTDLSRDVLKVR